jgi:hypothetical protein
MKPEKINNLNRERDNGPFEIGEGAKKLRTKCLLT